MPVKLYIDSFGQFKPLSKNHRGTTEVTRFTWITSNLMKVQVITYGATITGIMVPNDQGNVKEVTMGFDTIEEYQQGDKYFGAIIGRTANRIAKGKFTLMGKQHQLSLNRGSFHLHGGEVGFDKVNWNYIVDGNKVILSYLSMDGEEGYPGDVLATVIYEVLENNTLSINMKATSTKPTLIGMTNHAYFNLAGHDAGREALLEHKFFINGYQYTELDDELIPTGNIKFVKETLYNFHAGNWSIKADNLENIGYDINFCLKKETEDNFDKVCSVSCDGRRLEIFSNQPGVQFYTSNFLPDENDPPLKGKGGAFYKKHGAFCMETQNYPDSINHFHFPQSVLMPGEVYQHRVDYRFDTIKYVNQNYLNDLI